MGSDKCGKKGSARALAHDFFEASDMTYPFCDSDNSGIDATGNRNSVIAKAKRKAKTRAMINHFLNISKTLYGFRNTLFKEAIPL